MFGGYPDNHTGEVYRLIHLKTQHVMLSRDAGWMWNTYMRKQQHIHHGLQKDDDYEKTKMYQPWVTDNR